MSVCVEWVCECVYVWGRVGGDDRERGVIGCGRRKEGKREEKRESGRRQTDRQMDGQTDRQRQKGREEVVGGEREEGEKMGWVGEREGERMGEGERGGERKRRRQGRER